MTAAAVLALVSAVGGGVCGLLGGMRGRALGVGPTLLVSQAAALILLMGSVVVLGRRHRTGNTW